MRICIKRVYEAASPDDGERILVDRLWPRGLSKEKAAIDVWEKDVAPSAALRKWFGHDPLVYRLVTGLTLVTAIFDFLGALPAQASSPQLNAIVGFAKDFLPLYGLGLGWVCPAALGLAIGLALRLVRIKKAAR